MRQHQQTFPVDLTRVLDLAVLALALSVLASSLFLRRGSKAPSCDQGCWTELRESAVRNKQKLAHLLLADPISAAKPRNGNF
jgi:hypothetical protein